jgi:hypothetical protein
MWIKVDGFIVSSKAELENLENWDGDKEYRINTCATKYVEVETTVVSKDAEKYSDKYQTTYLLHFVDGSIMHVQGKPDDPAIHTLESLFGL